MPIKIPDRLPAREIIEREGIMIIRENDAVHQDVRPLRIALLNLMPHKVKTETQLARLIGSTPLQVELTLLRTGSYTPTNTSSEHMLAFYQTWKDVADQKFDGLIVTGAPVEEMPFEEVQYWPELCDIFAWARTNVYSTFNICWGGQAALNTYYGVPKHALARKMFGVFRHSKISDRSVIMRGFDDNFLVPVSRYTETRRADIEQIPGLEILAESDQSGLCLIQDRALRQIYMFNHLEYDAATLKDEYQRDLKTARGIHLPANYFPADDPDRLPVNSWRSHGHLMMGNWINALYQNVPFDISLLQPADGDDRSMFD